MFVSLELSNNLCSAAVQQLEPGAVAPLNSRGKCTTGVWVLESSMQQADNVSSDPLQKFIVKRRREKFV